MNKTLNLNLLLMRYVPKKFVARFKSRVLYIYLLNGKGSIKSIFSHPISKNLLDCTLLVTFYARKEPPFDLLDFLRTNWQSNLHYWLIENTYKHLYASFYIKVKPNKDSRQKTDLIVLKAEESLKMDRLMDTKT